MHSISRRFRKVNWLDAGVFLVLGALLLLMLPASIGHFLGTAKAQDTVSESVPVTELSPLSTQSDLFYLTASEQPALIASSSTSRDEKGSIADSQKVIDIDKNPLVGSLNTEEAEQYIQKAIVGEISICPSGEQIAVETHTGAWPAVYLLDNRDTAKPAWSKITDQGSVMFLGWHPDCEQALVRAEFVGVPDPGLWLVDIESKKHTLINIPDLVSPEGLLAAAFSPDGSKIVYSISDGMGYGSEIWSFDLSTNEHSLLREEETLVVGSLGWSPDGNQVAYSVLLDSPIAFAEAGLWYMQSDGSNPRFLAKMDGGHGQEPVWSSDGKQLVFVARDNPENQDANYESEALVSSIRAVDIESGEISILVDSDNARQLDIDLLPDGSLLFVSNRQSDSNTGKALEVWLRSDSGELQQLTSDGTNKRSPVYVPAVIK